MGKSDNENRRKSLDLAHRMISDRTLHVTSDGAVWRLRSNGNNIAPRRAENIGGKGYLRLSFQDPDNRKLRQVMAHRLVWEHFNGPSDLSLQINHKNLKKQDNRPENLEQITQSENLKHGWANGSVKPWTYARREGRVNKRYGKPVLTDTQRNEIVALKNSGITLKQIAKQFNVTSGQIHQVWRRDYRDKK